MGQPAEIRLGSQTVEADLVFGNNRIFVGVPTVSQRTALPVTVRVEGEIVASLNIFLRQPAAFTYVPADEEDPFGELSLDEYNRMQQSKASAAPASSSDVFSEPDFTPTGFVSDDEIRSASKASAESREISEGIVLDYDSDGNLVGIDIDNASRKVQLKELILRKLPSDITAVA